MIDEVDEGLRRLLTQSGVADSGVELAFEAPTRDWTAKRNGPSVNLFLYDLREDVTRRHTGMIEEQDGDGVVTGWRDPPRWFHLTYMVTAWTSRPPDEHRLLSAVLRCVTRTDALASSMLTGSLAELGLTVSLDVVGAAANGGPTTADVWSALDGELRPAIEVRVTAPVRGDLTAAGPAVTDGLVLRAAGSPDAVSNGSNGPGGLDGSDGSARRLRYTGSTPPEGEGFAPYRPRLEPGSRRRRRGRGTLP